MLAGRCGPWVSFLGTPCLRAGLYQLDVRSIKLLAQFSGLRVFVFERTAPANSSRQVDLDPYSWMTSIANGTRTRLPGPSQRAVRARDCFDGASTRVLSTPDTLAGTCTSNSTPHGSSLGYRDARNAHLSGALFLTAPLVDITYRKIGNADRIKKRSRPHFRRRPRNCLKSIFAFNIY